MNMSIFSSLCELPSSLSSLTLYSHSMVEGVGSWFAQSVIAGFTESSHSILNGGHGGDSHVAYEVHKFIHGGTTY